MQKADSILRFVPGEFVAAAARLLPDVASATAETMDAILDVPGYGAVRFTFERFHHRKGKASHWFWAVKSAVSMR